MRDDYEFRPRSDCFIDGGATLFYFFAAAATAAGGIAQYKAGQAAELEYRQRAEEEKTAARDREIQRNNRLLKALAQRNVEAAASGTELEGSPLAVINKDFAEYSLDQLTSEAMTQSRVRSLVKAGKNARRVGTIHAVSSLFAAGASAAQGVQGLAKPPPTGAGKGSGALGRIHGGST